MRLLLLRVLPISQLPLQLPRRQLLLPPWRMHASLQQRPRLLPFVQWSSHRWSCTVLQATIVRAATHVSVPNPASNAASAKAKATLQPPESRIFSQLLLPPAGCRTMTMHVVIASANTVARCGGCTPVHARLELRLLRHSPEARQWPGVATPIPHNSGKRCSAHSSARLLPTRPAWCQVP